MHRLNVAAELARTVVNGPGVRYAVWVQGCPFRCAGCFNQDFLPIVDRSIVDVDQLARRIVSTGGIEGVTYSGGEPMLQAEALYWLSTQLKEHGLTVLCYTGFTLEQVRRCRSTYAGKLLGLLDVLIDGRYVKEKSASLLWRGSSNQTVHFLSEAYVGYRPLVEADPAGIEIVVDGEGMTITGLLDKGIVDRISGMTDPDDNH